MANVLNKLLKKNKISQKINTQKNLVNTLNKLLKKKPNSKRIQYKLKLIGQQILDSTLKEIKIKTLNEF